MANKEVSLTFRADDQVSKAIDRMQSKVKGFAFTVDRMNAADPLGGKKGISRLEKIGDRAGDIGRALAPAAALTGIAVKQLVSAGADYELAMADLQGRMDDLTPENLKKMRVEARKLGVDMGVGVQGAIEAFTELAKAGASADDILSGAGKTAIYLSKAEGISTEAAAGLLSNTLKIFGKDFSQAETVADQLAKAAGISSISIIDLENSMRHAALSASAYGIEVNELAAGIATLGNLGIRGEMGGTTLRSLMNTLGGDRRRQAKLVAKGADKSDFFETVLDPNTGKMKERMKGFEQIFTALNKLNLTGEDFAEIFGKEFGGSIRKASMAAGLFAGDLRKINEESEGYLSKLAKMKLNTFWGSWDRMKKAFEDIGNSMAEDGTLDTIRYFVDKLRELFEWFNKLSPKTKKFILILGVSLIVFTAAAFAIAGIAGALGVLGLAIGGGVGLGALTGAFFSLIAAIGLASWAVAEFFSVVTDDVWLEDLMKNMNLFTQDLNDTFGTKIPKLTVLTEEEKRLKYNLEHTNRDPEFERLLDDTFMPDGSLPWQRDANSSIDINILGLPVGSTVQTKGPMFSPNSSSNLNLGYTSKYLMPKARP